MHKNTKEDNNLLITAQIEQEKGMTEESTSKYIKELENSIQNGNFGYSSAGTKIISKILDDYTKSIERYLKDYSSEKSIRATLAASVISSLNDVQSVAYLASKIILSSIYTKESIQSVYKAIGQGIEDEYKMRAYKKENLEYYRTIQNDLLKRSAKPKRRKTITSAVFNKRLDFHVNSWTLTKKVQTGLVLVRLFVESTALIEFEDIYKNKKHCKILVPTKELTEMIESEKERLEVIRPFYLPMLCPPKDWTGILDGGYISPYLKKNKLIKNNSKDYLKKLSTVDMPTVYEAINHIQATSWQINQKVLAAVQRLWELKERIAGLPDREDKEISPYPYPEKDSKTDIFSEEELNTIREWKRNSYEIYKKNVQQRSIRILTAEIISLANRYKGCERIWFPYQMDFRGRIYPIPVLLQPQGSDLAKGLLRFSEGKSVDEKGIRWLEIHGANVYGYDKESYDKRVERIKSRVDEIKSYAENPILNKGWAKADKPFQFLAFCFEYSDYLRDSKNFRTHIPVQLDGTCNGLQHYSALLRDEKSAKAVNLINSDKPNDIYETVAQNLTEKLNSLTGSDSIIAEKWLSLGINRKLTKRPVMVLPYGGSIYSCREYIEDYIKENYTDKSLWEYFKLGENPKECVFKISIWLSKYLWASIKETLSSAIKGMDYIKEIARVLNTKKSYIEWKTPIGLVVRQEYRDRKSKEIKTELYGSIIKTRVNEEKENTTDKKRQINGICPNFIHSLDGACLMKYLIKCKRMGINSVMAVHDCYGVHACDTELSAKLLRESFVEIYKEPVLERFKEDILSGIETSYGEKAVLTLGELDIEEVKKSEYFFN